MKKQTWQHWSPGPPIHAPERCVGFFLIPASGRPSASTGRGGTGIVKGALGGTPWGTVTSSGRPAPALVVADESEKLGSAANNREGAANQKVETFAEWVRLSPASP